VTTAKDGTWRIGPVATGRYELLVEHIGYAPIERPVDVPLEDATLRLSMTARPLALDALVVTAGRRTQRLADAAVATELVTSREIRETGATDLASVLTERTGLELAGGHPVGEGVMIQGMGSERVLVLMDGQPFIGRISGSIDVSRIPTSMIERVEVVKGPQSTLYGSEAMGGVVNVITRNPDGSVWTPSLRATAGNRGRMDVSGTLMGGAGSVTGLVDAGRRSIELTASRARRARWQRDGTDWRRSAGGPRWTAFASRPAACSSTSGSVGRAASSTSSRTTCSGAVVWAVSGNAGATGWCRRCT
jgi:outer membrane receptor for ferrienterochelin and colicins